MNVSQIKFKELRLQAGLTQAELATRLGVRTQFISNIERDIASIPIKLINRCAKILKRDPEIFIQWNLERHEMLVRKKLNKKNG